MKERLLQIANYKKISGREFSRKINKSEGFLNMAKNITVDVLNNILDAFPEVNSEWLITGKGEMLKEETHPVPVMDKNALEMIKELSAENAI
jgi:hypothetical protein